MPKRIRPITIDRDIVRVPLTQGLSAVVDLRDRELVEGRNWHAQRSRGTFYAYSNEPGGGMAIMHRLILGLSPGDQQVDHIDGNGLNNRRANLRQADVGRNMANRSAVTGSSSRFKGVHSHDGGRWRAQIRVDGRQRHLGLFDDEEAAARAYDEAAVKAHGEFARLNLPRVRS